MALFNVPETVLSNLMIFLNRVEYKGLTETQALNEIINCFNSPITDKENQNKE